MIVAARKGGRYIRARQIIGYVQEVLMRTILLPIFFIIALIVILAISCSAIFLIRRKNYGWGLTFFSLAVILAILGGWGTLRLDYMTSLFLSVSPKRGVSIQMNYKIVDPTNIQEAIDIVGLSKEQIEEKIINALFIAPTSFNFVEINPAEGIIAGLIRILIRNRLKDYIAEDLAPRWCIHDGYGVINPPSEVRRLEKRPEPHYDLESGKGLMIDYGPHISPAAPLEYVNGRKTLRLKFYVTYKMRKLDPINEYYSYFKAHLTPELKFVYDWKEGGIFTGQNIFKEECIIR
jgi:hypothetical protein